MTQDQFFSKIVSWEQEGDTGHSGWTKQVEWADATTGTNLGANVGLGDTFDSIFGISKLHWKPNGVKCSNRKCNKNYGLLQDRPAHCRRCGGSFCAICVAYSRKLNRLGHLDPAGVLYKVCFDCYEEGKDLDGQTRNWTVAFKKFRKTFMEKSILLEKNSIPANWRSRFSLEVECQRLLTGFKHSLANSDVKKALVEVKNLVSTPQWQKSQFWMMENMADGCQMCKNKFSKFEVKPRCKVCAKCVCKVCSSMDLLLYVPDEPYDQEDSVEPKLAIIKVQGSPVEEPQVSMYLRVCKQCLEKLTNRQLEKRLFDLSMPKVDVLEDLNKVHCILMELTGKITQQLKDYKSIVESLEDGTKKNPNSSQSNMKVLAKAQEDVADFLSSFTLKVQILKRMEPQTNKQATLFRNCLKSKCDFYLDSKYQFSKLQRKLSNSVTPETLEVVQKLVDKHAIVSSQLYIRQLVYEAIHLCQKHNIEDSIPELLTEVDKAIENDVEPLLQADGEDLEEHQINIRSMVHTQMKEHRLIRPSKRLTMIEGKQHIQKILQQRTMDTIEKIDVQLNNKSAHRSFSASKAQIKNCRLMLQALEDM